MLLKKLAKIFENEREMPIELPEIERAIVDVLCVQDHIIFSAEDMNPELCRGTYYQYTIRPALYAPPELHTLIVYSEHLDNPWKRLVCFKELVHVLDKTEGKTRTSADLVAFTEALLAPSSADEIGLADYQALEDRHAIYRALAVIFPPAARADAIDLLQSGTKTIDEIADWVSLPRRFVLMVMHDNWPQIRNEILEY